MRPATGTDAVGRRSRRGVSRGRATGVSSSESLVGRTGGSCGQPTPRLSEGALTRALQARCSRATVPADACRACHPTCHNGRRDSAWRDGSDGGARIAPGPGGDRPRRVDARLRARAPPSRARCGRSRDPVGAPGARSRTGRPPTACSGCCTPRTCTSAPATPTSGSAAAAQRERQFAAFAPAWTSPSPRRSTCSSSPATCSTPTSSRAAPWSASPHELARLVAGRDPDRPRSRARTTSTTARRSTAPTTSRRWPGVDGARRTCVTVLTPDRPWVHLDALDAIVHGRVLRHQAGAAQPARATSTRRRRRDATWKIGLLHAAVAIPGRTDGDDVVITHRRDRGERASTTSRSATGTAPRSRRPRGVTYAYAARRSRSPLDQDKAGKVLLVTLERQGRREAGRRSRSASSGGPRFERHRGRRRELESPARPRRRGCAPRATRTACSTCALIGVRPDELDLDADGGRGGPRGPAS